MKKIGVFKMLAAMAVIMGLVQGAWAMTAAEIATYINANSLNASSSENSSIVTVTGNLGATPSNSDFLTLDIDPDVTVIWEATLEGTPSGSYSLINIKNGSGTFRVASGSIINNGSGRAITNNSASTATVAGGTVKAAGSYAIYNASTGMINVTSGTVENTSSGDYSYAIYNNSTGGTVNVSGGTVSYIYNRNSGGTVNITGGTIGSTTMTTRAIYNYGTLNISGSTTKITSAVAGSSNGTIYQEGGTLNITSGMVENVAATLYNGTLYGGGSAINNQSSSGTINISGGMVSSDNDHAIYCRYVGTINISGNGTVSTSGSGKSALYIGSYSSNDTVKITGGTVTSQGDGYAVYGSLSTIILGGNPTINGRIYTNPDKLSVITSASDIFEPGTNTYTLDFPNIQSGVSRIAVMNGKDFLDNFKLYNPDYVLNVAGQHLAVTTVTPILSPQIATGNHLTQTQNALNLTTKTNATIAVYNLSGNLISQQNYIAGNHSISLGHLPKGMYIVKASFDGGKEVLKMAVR